jgi:stage V sporulation protein AD
VGGAAAVGGAAEAAGPLGEKFTQLFADSKLGEDSWELGESKLLAAALRHALAQANRTPEEIDLLLCGDLLNQCTPTAFAARDVAVPLAGLYGACSTFAIALALGALLVDGGHFDAVLTAASSHFCAAEKQFRFPLEYGGQTPPAAQRTATAAGAVVLEAPRITAESEMLSENFQKLSENLRRVVFRKQTRTNLEQQPNTPPQKDVFIRAVTLGKIVDLGVTDPAQMGAAMAPAACDTLLRFLRDTETTPQDYDCILTGDLGQVGTDLLRELTLREANIDISSCHQDGGLLLFDKETQDVGAGGSGAGCSAAVVVTDTLPKLVQGVYRNTLFIGTGALLSAISPLQGQTIPCVAHAVLLKAE